jgi:C1A family cysteine protease
MKVFAVIVTISLLCGAISASSLKQLAKDEWVGFKLENNKVYDSLTEEQYRYRVYLDNRDFIAQHNQRHALGLETYELGVNHLADMTYEEVLQQFAGYNSTGVSFDLEDEDNDDSEQWLEDDAKLGAFDWRQKLTLGHVKNQRDCGSCWAFTALTTVEHHLRIHKKVKVDLSEQQLIDCSRSYGNAGCQGGLMDHAYQYIQVSWYPELVRYLHSNFQIPERRNHQRGQLSVRSP